MENKMINIMNDLKYRLKEQGYDKATLDECDAVIADLKRLEKIDNLDLEKALTDLKILGGCKDTFTLTMIQDTEPYRNIKKVLSVIAGTDCPVTLREFMRDNTDKKHKSRFVFKLGSNNVSVTGVEEFCKYYLSNLLDDYLVKKSLEERIYSYVGGDYTGSIYQLEVAYKAEKR